MNLIVFINANVGYFYKKNSYGIKYKTIEKKVYFKELIAIYARLKLILF